MRADNTSVVTLMLDPPGPPRATVLRSRTTQKPQSSVPVGPLAGPGQTHQQKPEEKTETHTESSSNQVPQNGLTIMTRYSDVDKPATSPDLPERTPLPPCATLDGRFSLGPQDEPQKEDEDADAITNYGNPAESYFMARLLNRTRVVNTLCDVYDEIVNGRPPKAASEPRETTPEATALPEVSDAPRQRSPEKEVVPADGAGGTDVKDAPQRRDKDDVGIQINEVSSSSPTEGPPRVKGRRPKAEPRRDAPAPNDRVLRSHHEPSPPPRPITRGASRARPAPPQPPPALERVVILSRRAAPVAAAPFVRVERAPLRRQPDSPPVGEPDRPRATRSQGAAGPAPPTAAAAATPLAQKITRSISSVARELRGNSTRAPGPLRRTPAARREPSLGSKENLGARRRARARPAASEPARPPRRRADSPQAPEPVHSTTAAEPRLACLPAPPRPRALRSRNEAPPPAAKRRCEELLALGAGGGAAGGAAKAPKLAAERCARALGKRASGPWAPALALRNRLRKRLTK